MTYENDGRIMDREFNKMEDIIMENYERYCKICGQRVKECRNHLGLSLKDLADKVDMTKQGISRIENGELGKTQILKNNLKSLAIALQCSELYLTGETDEVRGTGIKVNYNGEQKELVSPLIRFDYIDKLTKQMHEMGPQNAELIDLFINQIVKMKPEEQEQIKAYLKSLPSYERYKKAKKYLTAEYIIAEMHEDCFTKKIYETIYRTIHEEDVIRLKKRRLKKEEFVDQMKTKYENEILEFVRKEMGQILDTAFKSSYSPNRIKKGPLSRMKK